MQWRNEETYDIRYELAYLKKTNKSKFGTSSDIDTESTYFKTIGV